MREPSSLFGATLQGIQSKFYGMGLMYALNSRISFKQQWADEPDRANVRLVSSHTSVSPSILSVLQGQVFVLSSRPTAKNEIQVDVETETYVQVCRGLE